MIAWKIIESLNLCNDANNLLRAIIKTDNINTNFYIGTINTIPLGDNDLEQLPWIPKKIKNIQNQTEILHNESISLNSISEYANQTEIENSRGVAVTMMRRILKERNQNINGQIKNIIIALKDLQNAISSIDFPTELVVNNLFKIESNKFEQVVDETKKIKYHSSLQFLTECCMESPMHYIIYSLLEDKNMAFVLDGYKIAPKLGAGYHQIWCNLNDNPLMISNECVWKS